MTLLLWLAGLGLFGVAAGGLFYAVTRTDYLPRLGAWLATTAWKYFAPIIFKRKSPEEEAKDRQIVREGGKQKDGGR